MKYAVIRMSGKQYKISEGDEILVDKLGNEEGDAEVLLVVDGDHVELGKPVVASAKLKLKVLEKEVKGDKIYVQTFRSKSRFRRKIGFRPKYTKVLVEKIS